MECVSKVEAFRAMMENRQKSVENMFEREKEETIEKNRDGLRSIVPIIIFCGEHNLPLRDDWHGKHAQSNREQNLGNFRALIEFRIEAGDLKLKQSIENAPKNCTYLSKTTQNQLINILGDVIRDEILGEIRKATYFSISADEAADCSNKEQLSLTIRFVDSLDNVCKEFIEFDHCKEGTTGEALAEQIKGRLQALGLQLENIRGQCYDGAGAMRVKDKGVGPRIQ